MSNRLGLLAVALVAGCATDLERAPSSTAPPGMQPPPPAVLVQAMILEVPPSRLDDIAGLSFARLAALPDVTVLTNPSLIVQAGVPASVDIGPSPSLHLDVTSELLANDSAWLDLRLTGDTEASTSQLVRNAQSIVVRAHQAAGPRATTLLVLRSDVVRSQADVRRLRRERCPDCALD